MQWFCTSGCSSVTQQPTLFSKEPVDKVVMYHLESAFSPSLPHFPFSITPASLG